MVSLRTKLLVVVFVVLAFNIVEISMNGFNWNSLDGILHIIESIVIVALIVFIARTAVHPLGQLAESARELQSGTREQIAIPRGDSDVRQIAHSINAIAATQRETASSEREQLRRAQESVRAVIDSFPHPVALVSTEGLIEIVNTAAGKFNLATGMDVRQTSHPWLPELVDIVRATRGRAGRDDPHSLVQVFDAGRELFFLPQASPVLDASGRVIGITVILLDVTEERQNLEAKSGLVSAVSHEIKTPITSLQMSIHLLIEDTQKTLPPRQFDLLCSARDDADRLLRLIDEWLTKARAQR